MVRHRIDEVPRRFGRIDEQSRTLDQALREAARSQSAHYLSLLDMLCDGRGCLTLVAGDAAAPDLMFRDEDHLTRTGARFVARTGRDTLLGEPADPPLSPAPRTASSSP